MVTLSIEEVFKSLTNKTILGACTIIASKGLLGCLIHFAVKP